MNAAIIIIGDEILSGSTLDTNSGFIASELQKIGISVEQIFTIPDRIDLIKNTLKQALKTAQIVISSGGLGPTKDDKTKTAFKEFFNCGLKTHEATLDHLKKILKQKNRIHLLDIHCSQAEILTKAKVFTNHHGTAPCQMIEENERITFCLPGVPYELKPLITEQIIPYLAHFSPKNTILSRTISIVGIPESELSLKMETWEQALPKNLSLSYLPIGNRIKLKLTAKGEDQHSLNQLIESEIKKLKPLIEQYVIAWHGEEIQEILKEVLTRKRLSLSAAESCTGGAIAKKITSMSGSSDYFYGGVVTYKTITKNQLLNVPLELIKEHTVVSAAVAQAMAKGCMERFGTDISIATTGVAGPDTDEFNSNVGTAYYAIKTKNHEVVHQLYLPHMDRNDFIDYVSQKVLQDLVNILVKT